MKGGIPVLNCGSSSIKFSLFNGDEPLTLLGYGAIEGLGGPGRFRANDRENRQLLDRSIPNHGKRDYEQAPAALVEWGKSRDAARDVSVASYHVVHGAAEFFGPVHVNAQILNQLEALTPLAPSHQPQDLAGIRALAMIRPALALLPGRPGPEGRSLDPPHGRPRTGDSRRARGNGSGGFLGRRPAREALRRIAWRGDGGRWIRLEPAAWVETCSE